MFLAIHDGDLPQVILYPLVTIQKTMGDHHFLLGKFTMTGHFQKRTVSLPDGNCPNIFPVFGW